MCFQISVKNLDSSYSHLHMTAHDSKWSVVIPLSYYFLCDPQVWNWKYLLRGRNDPRDRRSKSQASCSHYPQVSALLIFKKHNGGKDIHRIDKQMLADCILQRTHLGMTINFHPLTFLLSHAMTSSKHVAQEKIFSWNGILPRLI